MLQRLLTILLVTLGIHLSGAHGGFAATIQKPEQTIRLRSCLTVNKTSGEDPKIRHSVSVRPRVPQVSKTVYPRNPMLTGSVQGPAPGWSTGSPTAAGGAGTDYILRLIYPFHYFL
ncbi:MAG TPA: hypothetical protein VGD92_14045 [Sphingobacteriaceae bacterium]